MADGSKVLPNDFGFPYVWIFSQQRETVLLKDVRGNNINMNQLITSFEYKYSEEDDDTCIIKFHIESIAQLNHWLFREDQKFCVQFGYILPNNSLVKGPLRTIAVRTINTNYKKDGVDIELNCTDLVSYLRNVRYNRSSNSNNFEAWLREIVGGQYVPTITIGGAINILKTEQDAETYKDIAGVTNLHLETEPLQVIKGKSKAITAEIEERLNQSTKGPLYLDGRDNVLNIIKRDFNQKPYKQFTYWGGDGELIEFRSKSNIITSRDDEAEEGIINQVTKKVNTTKNAINVDYDDGKNNPDDVKERIKNNKVVDIFKKKFEDAVENPLDQEVLDTVVIRDEMKYGGNYAGATNVMGTTRVAYKGPRWVMQNAFASKQLLNSPHILQARRIALIQNYILKKVEKKYEATLKTLGDPSLITSKIYDLKNLSDRDKGNWYAVSATHLITPNESYITTLEVIKKPKRLANLLQKRDDTPQFSESGEFEPSPEIAYEETKAIINTTEVITEGSFLNVEDMTNRINEQIVFNESYFTNDIPFNTQEKVTDLNINTVDSQDV